MQKRSSSWTALVATMFFGIMVVGSMIHASLDAQARPVVLKKVTRLVSRSSGQAVPLAGTTLSELQVPEETSGLVQGVGLYLDLEGVGLGTEVILTSPSGAEVVVLRVDAADRRLLPGGQLKGWFGQDTMKTVEPLDSFLGELPGGPWSLTIEPRQSGGGEAPLLRGWRLDLQVGSDTVMGAFGTAGEYDQPHRRRPCGCGGGGVD